MACSVTFEIDASSESLRLLIRENNSQHCIFNKGLQDSLGAVTLLKFVFHVDSQSRFSRQDRLLKTCGKAVYNAKNRLGLGLRWMLLRLPSHGR